MDRRGLLHKLSPQVIADLIRRLCLPCLVSSTFATHSSSIDQSASISSLDNQQKYLSVPPGAELHLLDSGHCALADKGGEIASRVHEFLGRVV
jgi:hypothetical protein